MREVLEAPLVEMSDTEDRAGLFM